MLTMTTPAPHPLREADPRPLAADEAARSARPGAARQPPWWRGAGRCRTLIAVNIRPLCAADVEPLALIVERGGWGDLRRQLAFYLAHPDCHPYLAEVDGRPAGTATAVRKGEVGWFAHVFVAPERRGRGLGTALALRVAAELEALGCRTLLLAATPMGRPLYEKLGFAPDGEYAVYSGPALPTTPADAALRPLTPADLPAVVALDRAATGEDRSRLLARLTGEGWAATDGPGGALLGHYVPTPWGGGAVVAADATVGRRLLALRRGLAGQAGRAELTLPLPAANAAARDELLAAGFGETRRSTRMRRGVPLAWRPELIWGVFSLGLG